MKRRFVLAALPFALLLAAAAPPPAPKAPPVLNPVERVAIETSLGTIVLELDGAHAPVTVANFLRYADEHRLDGTTFYRSMHLAWGDQPNGLIQGGAQGHPARVLPPIAHEPTSETGVHHTAGAISMARHAPGSATADFSIMLSDLTGLDADPASDNPELQAGYAAFGHVVEGMEVVRAIWDAPISANMGEGALKGQMIENPVQILAVRRLPPPPPPPSAPTPEPTEDQTPTLSP